jgi:integrase
MADELVPLTRPGPSALIIEPRLLKHAKRFLAAAKATNTRRARRSDWRIFSDWCREHGHQELPASISTVVNFLFDCAGGEDMNVRKPSTLARYLSSIATAQRAAGYEINMDNVQITDAMDGICRELGMRQRLAAPITSEILTQVEPFCDRRDWAILCFGQASACRRSELCALDIADVRIEVRGAEVFLAKSKTDQMGRGHKLGVKRNPGPLCPVTALEVWLDLRGEEPGPLFVSLKRNRKPSTKRLTDHDLNRIVKKAIAAAGLPPEGYSAHSLRAGYVTDARQAGVSWVKIMTHTRHTQLSTVKGYSRYDVDPLGDAEKD